MKRLQPRSAGSLQIGSVIYDSQKSVFSVEMLFTGNGQFSPEDEMKSAARSAGQYFLKLLHEHGYHDHGEPETVTKVTGPRRVLIYVACKARKARPAIILLRDPHPDANGRSKTDDAT